MNRVVIAHDETVSLCVDCADETRVDTVTAGIDYQLMCADQLTMSNVTDVLNELDAPNVLTAFSHGTTRGFQNSSEEYYVDKDEATGLLYKLAGHMVYAIACYSGVDELVGEMLRKGVVAYWGYKDEFVYRKEEGLGKCVTTGLRSMLQGKTLGEAKQDLLDNLQRFADDCANDDPISSGLILFDKKNLIVEGDDKLVL